MMTTLLRVAVAACSVALLASCTHASSGDSPTPPPNGSIPYADPPAEGNPGAWSVGAVTPESVQAAVAALPTLIADAQERTGVPGMAASVVYNDEVLFAEGFGVRSVDGGEPVDAETVFQLASLSKPIGATAISAVIDTGAVAWQDRIVDYLPWFALDDSYVTANVQIADMYSHRSGLPLHAGDDLEDIGYDRREVLDRLRYLPLTPFREVYAYTNFGLTAGGEAVATAIGTDWDTLAEDYLFGPAGMTSSSFSFADYEAAPNRAIGHQRVDGEWVHVETRDPQAQAPAGSASSDVVDLARWMRLHLANGTLDGEELIDPDVLQVMRQPHMVSGVSLDPAARSGLYGYGLGTGANGSGMVTWSHSGAFLLGAGTVVNMLPAAGLGIAVVSNASPVGAVEAIAQAFLDIALYGQVQRDWIATFDAAFAPMFTDPSELAGRTPPEGATPAAPPAAYAGTYSNDYVGDVVIEAVDGTLVMGLGPDLIPFELTSWGGDLFSYQPTGENALGLSAVTFDLVAGTVTIEQLNSAGMGTLTKRR